MIGDNSSDIMAGKNASTYTCGIEWSIKKDLIRSLNPDFWIKDYLELLDIVIYNKED